MSGVPDYVLEDTIDFKFTSRSFSTGAPTTLSGTPAVEIYEDNSLTQITAAETLTVDFDSVTGLNNLRVAATAANGFEAGKSYHCVISAGTVGGVSVVGEVVAQFSIQRSPVNWAKVTAPTTAVDLSATDIQLVDTVTTYTGNTVQTGDAFARLGAPAGASVSADVAAIKAETVEIGTPSDLGSGTTLAGNLADMAGATFATGTDSLEAIRDRGDAAWTTGAGGSDRLLMVDTTIATLASQTSFTLTAGSADDDAYNNCTIVIEDASTATQKAVGLVSDYTGSTKTVTLKYDPAVFTMAATDKVYILAENALKASLANRQLDVTATGAAGIDWGNVENQGSTVDLSATDIQLCDTVSSVTGAVGSVTAGVTLANGAITDASLAGNMEIVFETDFATNYNATRNAWVTNAQDFVGTTASDPFNAQVVAASVTGAVGSVTGSVGSVTGSVGSVTGAVGSVTGNVGGNVTGSIGALTSAAIADVWSTDTLTEAYATDGSAATPAELLYMLWSCVSEFAITSTTITSKKLDGSTTAMTFTLDSATVPTSRTRAT